MMITTQKLIARAGAAAIAAALALSPTYAATPQPVIDLSKSPALSDEGQTATAANPAPEASPMIGPVSQRTAEIGGGALALLALGGAALAVRSRKRRREEEEAWSYDSVEPEVELTTNEPMTLTNEIGNSHEAATDPQPSAFAWDKERPCDQPVDDGSDRCPGESWVERAHRGPSPANPSASLKTRLSRAAFFDKRERDVAAGKAEPVDPEAGLPEAMVEDREVETA